MYIRVWQVGGLGYILVFFRSDCSNHCIVLYLRDLIKHHPPIPTPDPDPDPNMANNDLILLTGATGFVGFAVLRAALQHGYRIRAAVRSEAKATLIRTNPSLKDVSPEQLSLVVVPDILAEGAFDSAAQGVKYILHVASPIPSPGIAGEDDLDAILIQPAIQGTLGIYRSAQRAGTVKRVVVTSSAAAIVPLAAMLDPSSAEAHATYTPDSRANAEPAPFMNNVQVAYNASKILALKHAEDFVRSEKPGFDAIHIHPVLVLGRDELNLKSEDVSRGSNAIALNPVLGVKAETPFPISVTHIDDVALAHVRALDEGVEGNQSFLLSNTGEEGYSVSIISFLFGRVLLFLDRVKLTQMFAKTVRRRRSFCEEALPGRC